MISPDPAQGLTPAERHRMEVDEAVARLTHRCRMRTGLKLSPSACEQRKGKRQKIFAGKSYPIFEECNGCPGPVPLDEPAPISDVTQPADPPKPAQRPPKKGRKKYIKPTVCRTCGRAPSAEVRFYYSRPDECIACIKSRTAERKANEKKTWRSLEVEEQPEVKEEAKYHCETHGPHNGRMFGRQVSKLCPQCYAIKASEVMKKAKANARNKAANGHSGGIQLPDWVSAWAEEIGAERGVSALEIVVGLIGQEISSDWLKSWLIDQSMKKEA